MHQIIREIRRHSNYFYYAVRTILRLDVLPAWAVGKNARICCVAVLGLLFSGYIAVVSVASGSGYEMRDLEKQVAGLKKEIQKNEVAIAEYNSMNLLSERVKNSGLVKIEDITYVSRIDQPTVAKR